MDDALFVLGSTYTHGLSDLEEHESEGRRVERGGDRRFRSGRGTRRSFSMTMGGSTSTTARATTIRSMAGRSTEKRSSRSASGGSSFGSHDDVHGWERFGEANDNTFLRPFIEGAWMTKHGGKYYLQYGAPGTEFSGYGDGVYVGERPLGPFTYQAHNPVSYKPGGFARGAGHGSTFQDPHGNWWHTSTIGISREEQLRAADRDLAGRIRRGRRHVLQHGVRRLSPFSAACVGCRGTPGNVRRLDAAQLREAGDRVVDVGRLRGELRGGRGPQNVLERGDGESRRMVGHRSGSREHGPRDSSQLCRPGRDR